MARDHSAPPGKRLRAAGAAASSPPDRAQPPAPDRRDEILVVARDLFFTHGFASASMRDIAAGIGLTQAAIYYHFTGKDEILFALVDAFTQSLHGILLRALHASGDPVEDLRRAVRAHILLSRTHFREIKLVTEDKKLLGPAYTERVRQRELSIYALYRERVAELNAAGLCRPLAPSVVVFNMLAMINFIFQWYRPDGQLQLEDIADQTVSLLTRGLLADPPAVATRSSKPPMRPPTLPRGDRK